MRILDIFQSACDSASLQLVAGDKNLVNLEADNIVNDFFFVDDAFKITQRGFKTYNVEVFAGAGSPSRLDDESPDRVERLARLIENIARVQNFLEQDDRVLGVVTLSSMQVFKKQFDGVFDIVQTNFSFAVVFNPNLC